MSARMTLFGLMFLSIFSLAVPAYATDNTEFSLPKGWNPSWVARLVTGEKANFAKFTFFHPNGRQIILFDKAGKLTDKQYRLPVNTKIVIPENLVMTKQVAASGKTLAQLCSQYRVSTSDCLEVRTANRLANLNAKIAGDVRIPVWFSVVDVAALPVPPGFQTLGGVAVDSSKVRPAFPVAELPPSNWSDDPSLLIATTAVVLLLAAVLLFIIFRPAFALPYLKLPTWLNISWPFQAWPNISYSKYIPSLAWPNIQLPGFKKTVSFFMPDRNRPYNIATYFRRMSRDDLDACVLFKQAFVDYLASANTYRVRELDLTGSQVFRNGTVCLTVYGKGNNNFPNLRDHAQNVDQAVKSFMNEPEAKSFLLVDAQAVHSEKLDKDGVKFEFWLRPNLKKE